jgi:putative FmdB family regulatory protein
MPIYEFECGECNHRFQEIMSVNDWEKKQKKGFTCPECKSKNVDEVLSASVQTSKKS